MAPNIHICGRSDYYFATQNIVRTSSATSIKNNTMPTKASAQPTRLLQTATQTQAEYPNQSKDGNDGKSKTSPPSESSGLKRESTHVLCLRKIHP